MLPILISSQRLRLCDSSHSRHSQRCRHRSHSRYASPQSPFSKFLVPYPTLVNILSACRTLASAKKLSEGVKNAKPTSLDVSDDKALDAAVAQHDLVISLIPYTFHATVIKSAIRNKKNVVTTSYVSPAMLELEQQAKDAGITVMNEIGVSFFFEDVGDLVVGMH